MEPTRKNKPSAVLVNTSEEAKLEDGNVKDLIVKRRRTEFSWSIVKLKQEIEVVGMENKVADGLPVEDSTGKDPMDMLTDCVVQNSGQANGCSNEHVYHFSFQGNESASSMLPKMCKAIGWKEPSIDFEEQGPPHNRMYTCKVTVHLVGLSNTIVECFSDPKLKKKAAQEQAAQGALWCLKRFGQC